MEFVAKKGVQKTGKEQFEILPVSDEDLSGVIPATPQESLQMEATDPRNVARFRAEVDAAINGTMPSYSLILLGKPSAILQKYMKSTNPLYMPQKAAKKGALTKDLGGKHGLGKAVIYDLLYQFEDPLAITGNTTEHVKKGENSIVVWDYNNNKVASDGYIYVVEQQVDDNPFADLPIIDDEDLPTFEESTTVLGKPKKSVKF